jgi:hypothetical protein
MLRAQTETSTKSLGERSSSTHRLFSGFPLMIMSIAVATAAAVARRVAICTSIGSLTEHLTLF